MFLRVLNGLAPADLIGKVQCLPFTVACIPTASLIIASEGSFF